MGKAQLSLPLRNTWGGRRAGAGRKPRNPKRLNVPHRPRLVHKSRYPLHVTLRCVVRSLRAQQLTAMLMRCFRKAQRADFRIVHYSIQADHLHLIVEAENRSSLISGMRGLAIRVARLLNPILFRRGRFWADRWHSRELTSPRSVRNALVYVLMNHKKHLRARGLDPLSSAEWFDGFISLETAASVEQHAARPPPVANAQTWLLGCGWKRRGLIHVNEAPRAPN